MGSANEKASRAGFLFRRSRHRTTHGRVPWRWRQFEARWCLRDRSLGPVRYRYSDGVDDLRVARTSADVAGDRHTHLVGCRIGVLPHECCQCHEKAWRAESALHRAGFNKSALKPVQVTVLTYKSFDRFDTATIHRQICDDARIGGVPVDQDGASATFALVAPALGSRQKEAVPQYAQEG